jgi:hypothetical protein
VHAFFFQSTVGVDSLAEILAVMEREESFQKGTTIWETTVDWLLTSAPDSLDLVWGWPALVKTAKDLVDSYLNVTHGKCFDFFFHCV